MAVLFFSPERRLHVGIVLCQLFLCILLLILFDSRSAQAALQTGAAQTGVAQTGAAQSGVAQVEVEQSGVVQIVAPEQPPTAYIGHIGNQIWHDQNNNGHFDPNEEGIANVVVKLYQGYNGDYHFNPADDTFVEATETDPTGQYWFDLEALAPLPNDLPNDPPDGPPSTLTDESPSRATYFVVIPALNFVEDRALVDFT